MSRTLTLRLKPFEWEALHAYGSSERVPPQRVVRTAVLYYLHQHPAKRETWRIPPFRRGGPDRGPELEVELGEEAEQALAKEAAAQGVDPAPLARHALLFFLADVDSGELAATLESILRDR